MPPKKGKKKPAPAPAPEPNQLDGSKEVATTDPLAVVPPQAGGAAAVPAPTQPPGAAASPEAPPSTDPGPPPPAQAATAGPAAPVPTALPPAAAAEQILAEPESSATPDLLGFKTMPGTAEAGGAAEDLASNEPQAAPPKSGTPRFVSRQLKLQNKFVTEADMMGRALKTDGLEDLANAMSFKITHETPKGIRRLAQLVQGITPFATVEFPNDMLIQDGHLAGHVELTAHNREMEGIEETRIATHLEASMRIPYAGPPVYEPRAFRDMLSYEAGPPAQGGLAAAAAQNVVMDPTKPALVPEGEATRCIHFGYKDIPTPPGENTLLAVPVLVHTQRLALLRKSVEAYRKVYVSEPSFVRQLIRDGKLHPDAIRMLEPYGGDDQTLDTPYEYKARVFEVQDIPMRTRHGLVRTPALNTLQRHYEIEDSLPPALRKFTQSLRDEAVRLAEREAANLIALPVQVGSELLGGARKAVDYSQYSRKLSSEDGVVVARTMVMMSLSGYRARIAITFPESVNAIDTAYSCYMMLRLFPHEMFVYRDFVSLIAGLLAPFYNLMDQAYENAAGAPELSSGYRSYAAGLGVAYIRWIENGQPGDFAPPMLPEPHMPMARIKSNPVRAPEVKQALMTMLTQLLNNGPAYVPLPPEYGAVRVHAWNAVGDVSSPFVPSVDLQSWLDPNSNGVEGNRYRVYSHNAQAEELILQLCAYVDLVGCMVGPGEGRGEAFLARMKEAALALQLSASIASISSVVALGARLPGLLPYQAGALTITGDADDRIFHVPLGGASSLIHLGCTSKMETPASRAGHFLPLAPVVEPKIHRDEALYNLLTILLYQRAIKNEHGQLLPLAELHRLREPIIASVEDSLKVWYGSLLPETRARLEHVHLNRDLYREDYEIPPCFLRDEALGVVEAPRDGDLFWTSAMGVDTKYARTITPFGRGAAPIVIPYAPAIQPHRDPVFGHIVPRVATVTNFFSAPGPVPARGFMIARKPVSIQAINLTAHEMLYVPGVLNHGHADLHAHPMFWGAGGQKFISLKNVLEHVTTADRKSEGSHSDAQLLRMLATYNMIHNTDYEYIYVDAHVGIKLELVAPDKDAFSESPGIKVQRKEYDRGLHVDKIDGDAITLPACVVGTTALMRGVAEVTELIPTLLTHIVVGLSTLHSDPRLLHRPIAYPSRHGNCTSASELSQRGPLTGQGFPVSTLVYVTGREERLQLTDELAMRAPTLIP